MNFICLSVALCATAVISTPSLTESEISDAMMLIVDTLQKRHDEVRCWDSVDQSHGWLSSDRGNTTALTTLALLSAGESSHSPQLQRAIDYIWDIENPSSYLLTLRTSIWALLPDEYEKRLEKDTKTLMKTMSLQYGGWSKDGSVPDTLSSTSPLTREFGIIALRSAKQRGIRIPNKYFISMANATLSSQHDDGGWSYVQTRTGGKTTANMTVAGLNCLLGAQEALSSELKSSDMHKLQIAIDTGLAWLDEHARVVNHGGTALMSYLYALERVAMVCGLAEINNRDWYVEGAKAAVHSHCGVRKARGSTVNLSFALLFLSRGKAPFTLCELVPHKAKIDPYRVADEVTKKVANKTERNLSWQQLTLDDGIRQWLKLPFMFIQDSSILLQTIHDDESVMKLKSYLDAGGLIVMLATGKELNGSKNLAEKLCPTLEPIEHRSGHWAHHILEDAESIHLTVWNDGVRDRVIVIQGNGERLTRSKNSKLSKLFVNICCGNAELDSWPSRLNQYTTTDALQTFVLAKHSGSWDAEANAFHTLKCKVIPLDEISDQPYVWVGGIDKTEANEELVNHLIALADAGSTIVVESIGGHGHFALSVQEQIISKKSVVLNQFQHSNWNPHKRAWSIKHRLNVPCPLIARIGKGKIWFIDCDVRNALQGRSTWGVHGYTTESANDLVRFVQCD